MTYALASCLNRGGKYIVTPHVPEVSTYRGSWNDYCRSVRLKLFFGNGPQRAFDPRYHVPNPTWMPPSAPMPVQEQLDKLWSDITAAEADSSDYWRRGKGVRRSNTPLSEVRALLDLKDRKDIIVKPADKNLGLTLIGREWYMEECYRQLGDTSTYKCYDALLHAHDSDAAALVARVRQDTLGFIKNMSLPANEKKWLLAETAKASQVPEFYVLPKLHKDPVKGRPIVAGHSWCTTPLSIWCANKLKPVVDGLFTVLRDTRDLIEKLDKLELDPLKEYVMSTADVESLYTNIPIDDAMRALENELRESLHPISFEERRMLCRAVEFVLRRNYLSFDGKVFKQVRGLAMGTPLAPPLANLFMYYMESTHVVPLRVDARRDFLYARFLDDIFVIQDFTNPTVCDGFWKALGSMHLNIKLTRESSRDSVPFLDLVIYREGNKLLYRVHQKALNKYLYISPRSCHPRHMIKGFVRTELIRYARNSSKLLDFLKISRAFSNRLRERGFHPCFLRHVFATVQFGVWPAREERPRPMVFKIDFGPGSLDHAISRVLAEWYENTPEAFKALIPKPLVCYRLGKNLYKLLVRAKAPT